MNILYLDLNYPDLVENYSLKPKTYGGGRIVPSALLHSLNKMGHRFDILSHSACFEGVSDENIQYCHLITEEHKNLLRNGYPLKNYLHPALHGYDIILHNWHGTKLNLEGLKARDLVWLVGFGEYVHPQNKRIVLYNNYQRPHVYTDTKVYYARIGVPIPEFQEYKKENYIFSCHRQSRYFGSELMMQLAHSMGFKYIVGGPKDNNFPNIMDYVDGKHVEYLGVMKEEEKIEYYKHAMCSTHLHDWNVPFNLGLIQSLTYGTPVITTTAGFLPSVVKNGVNGYMLQTQDDFATALERVTRLSQKACYESALEYSTELMVQEYLEVFKEVLKE
jgi:glycosyltransferase involved in cell wall biosynthesis